MGAREDLTGPGDAAARHWLQANRPLVAAQFATTIYGPLSTGALEASLRSLKRWLEDRRGSFRNQERTDRLLALMRNHLNGAASFGSYRRALTAYLINNRGEPTLPHREIRYPAGAGTLR